MRSNKLFKTEIEDARSLHGVRNVDAVLLSDIFQFSTKWEKWIVCYSLISVEK